VAAGTAEDVGGVDGNYRSEAADVLRSLIDRIELRPGGGGQRIAATLHGDLARRFAPSPAANKNSPKLRLRGVNCRWLRGLEATYRTWVHYEREAQK
jgi:hypothetical protein